MNYTISYAATDDLNDFMSLQQDVAANIPSDQHFALDDGEYFCKVVSGKGHVLMVRDSALAIAFCMLNFLDADEEDNLGIDLQFSQDQRQHVAHVESIFIRPGYQGKGIASNLLKEAVFLAISQNRHEILATIHPCNTASLRTFFSHSFTVSGFAYKYTNVPRVIMRHQPNRTYTKESIYVPCEDFSSHQLYLSQGLRGMCLRETSGTYAIGYQGRP